MKISLTTSCFALPLHELNCFWPMPNLEKCRFTINLGPQDVRWLSDQKVGCLMLLDVHPHLKVVDATFNVRNTFEGAFQAITPTCLGGAANGFPLLERLSISVSYSELEPSFDDDSLSDTVTIADFESDSDFDYVDRPKLSNEHLRQFVTKLPNLTELVLDCFVDTTKITRAGLMELCEIRPGLKCVCINAEKPEYESSNGSQKVYLRHWH